MDFNELITDFATRHQVEGLAAEDGSAAIEVDGIVVLLTSVEGKLLASAEIGEPPPEGSAAFADLLLEANLDSSAVFAKSRETANYLLLIRLALEGLDGEAFDAQLEAFINRAEIWRRLLADYRPAAAAAAQAEAENVAALGTGGFMQV